MTVPKDPARDAIVDRAARILLEEAGLLPTRDADGDVVCGTCGRLFATIQALGVHRTRAHKEAKT